MELKYYAETDSLYIDLAKSVSSDSKEISPGIVVDFDQEGNITGIDIDNASKKLDFRSVTLTHFPSDVRIKSA